ncbi:MAG: hypothetical protein MR771_02330 [Treponema succinifaciens]|uniref:hypothetical protein n=1 Tax=Treponema succinifaciens TaxID=167 RepID=UPI0023527C96|nr:hypothetical protein [Treponema succinifaciens]MCI6912000.1 hypothetical protein [Treponema succinifaciens]
MRNHKLRNTNVIFFCIKCKESSVASQGKRIINVFSIKLAFPDTVSWFKIAQ